MEEYTPGDSESFSRLYANSYKKAYYKALRMLHNEAEAEDVTHDAFLNAFKHWGAFEPLVPAEVWILRIVHNAAVTQLRKNKLRTVEAVIARIGIPREGDNPQDIIENKEIWKLVDSLPPKQAEVIRHRFLLGYNGRSTALKLGVEERTIASRLWAGKRTLKPQLQEVR